jgi:3-oxoacyl-[acyl-carrier protein] reductase
MARFEGKVVVITGGGAGIGRTYAHRFAVEGAKVVIADLDEVAARRVVDEVAVEGAHGLAQAMDVTDADAAAAMAARTVADLGGIDVLVNNAGVHLDHAQLPFTLDAVPKWRAVLDVNVIGALIGAAAIVNMSSMAAYGGSGAYGVSKLALNSLTVSLAAELAADGIRVNGIAPGLVDSEAAVEWWSDASRAGMEGIDQVLIGQQMIKRQGTMDDLADMCLFLCSDAASFVTGQTILVDGGHTKKPY